MKLGRFAITLAAAGYLPNPGLAYSLFGEGDTDEKGSSMFQIFKGQHTYTLAAHRSHSSHGSHASHRSSTGGSYSVPSYSAPLSNSTPPASILPSSPSAPITLPGNSAKFNAIVKQLQTALFVYGYYTGAIDGIVGPQTVAAISKFQLDWKLTVTGTVTPELLDALGILVN